MKFFGKKFALIFALIAVLAMAGSAMAAGGFTIEGKDSYDELADAVAAAEDNDTIIVAAGRYEVHKLTIDKPLQIFGTGSDTVFYATLANDDPNAGDSMIVLSGEIPGMQISGISFECTAPSSLKDASIIAVMGCGTVDAPIVIESCTFTGIAPEGDSATGAIAILTAASTNREYLVLNNNIMKNLKYGMYFNSINNVEITNNTISDTRYNAINVDASSGSYPSSAITIKNNTMSGIATEDYSDSRFTSGIYMGEHIDGDNKITTNIINMVEGKQENAIIGVSQGAQAITSDDNNVYFATLGDALENSDKLNGSTLAILTQPSEEDAALPITADVEIVCADGVTYTPAVGEGYTLVENPDGTYSIVAEEVKSDEELPTIEKPTEKPEEKPQTGSSSSGGCSAGFGALALLAALPLLRMRKK